MKFFIATILCLSACSELPGDVFTGVLQGSPTVILPMSGKKVCVGGLSWSVLSAGDKAPTITPASLRFAENATLLFKGDTLKIVGKVSDAIYYHGQQWRWSRTSVEKIPKAIWGWGGDSILDRLKGPTSQSYRRVTVSEKYADCRSVVSLRAIRNGNTLTLVEPQ